MEKSASAISGLLPEIEKRRSGRAFSTQEISDEIIERLLEAARWAPSSMNEQPWRYLIVKKSDVELYNKVFSTLAESNQVWVKSAPLLIVSLVNKNFIRNGNPNRHAYYDVGAANAFLSLQAVKEGLMVHQLGGFVHAQLVGNLVLDENKDIATVLSVGYPGSIDTLPINFQERELVPRERYVVSEITK